MPLKIITHPELTAADKIIFTFLNHDNKIKKICYKTNKELAQLAGVCEMKISGAIKKFKKLGLITVYYHTDAFWEAAKLKKEQPTSYTRIIYINK